MMKKFFLKAIIFLIGIVILTQTLAYVTGTIALDNNARVLQVDQKSVTQLLNATQPVEAIAIGNSHTQAIDFTVLGYNGHRLARSGRDIFEIKYYLDGLLPKLPDVKIVFITVSYFTFQRDNAVSAEVRIRRIHTYATIPSWRYIDGDFSNFLVGKLHPIFPVTEIAREDAWEGVAYGIVGDDDNPIEQTIIEQANNHCADKGYEYIATHADLRAAQHIQYAAEMTTNHTDLPLDVYQAMVDIIQDLQQRDIRLIFFTPPYFSGYTEFYRENDPEAIGLMQQNMRSLQHEYKIEYYDFSSDQAFAPNYQMFIDSDHINPCGAKQFSTKLKQILMSNEKAN